jgi:hypothetical protein
MDSHRLDHPDRMLFAETSIDDLGDILGLGIYVD